MYILIQRQVWHNKTSFRKTMAGQENTRITLTRSFTKKVCVCVCVLLQDHVLTLSFSQELNVRLIFLFGTVIIQPFRF